MPKKKLLTITIYEDINEPYEVELIGKHLKTINQNDLYQVIRDTIDARMQHEHNRFMQIMQEKGAIKHL